MLLEFRIKNYKSFIEETTFSMHPAPKQQDLNYSILNGKAGTKVIKALCSSVIYGPNASGKTNLIGAMEVFQSIVSRGHIRNISDQSTPNFANYNLELIPNSMLKEARSVDFEITFVEKELKIQYLLQIELGKFVQKDFARKIQKECLIINQENIFLRTGDSLQVKNPNISSKAIHWPLKKDPTSLTDTLSQNLNSQELFLTGGFKTIISRETAELVINWITKKFRIIYRADLLNTAPDIPDKKTGRFYVNKSTSDVAKTLGISSSEIGYVYDENMHRMQLCSNIKDDVIIPAQIYESFGTIRFINIFPLLVEILMTGGTLFIDEFDASIHPMVIMNIINIFHNEVINKKCAQLIFNTHNPIFLNRNLFRRDEIKFIDRDDSTHGSELYSLADFGTSGKNGVRKSDDYMKNYFINRYGAIRNIDFSPLFEKIFSQAEDEQ